MKLAVVSSTAWGSVFIKENMVGTEHFSKQGANVYRGKLNGRIITLIEQETDVPEVDKALLAEIKPEHVVSLGEAFSAKKNLDIGDMVISSAASYLDCGKPRQVVDVAVNRMLVDLGLKAAEKFNSDERICKVVVGKVFLDPGTAKTGRKLNFLPQEDIYCMDKTGYPLTQWVGEGTFPFVLVRTIIPIQDKYGRLEITQFRWDTAKKNFWIIKGILEGLKKTKIPHMTEKVDLI